MLREELYFEYLFKKLVKLGDKYHLTLTGVIDSLRKKVSLLGLLKLTERVEKTAVQQFLLEKQLKIQIKVNENQKLMNKKLEASLWT